MARGHAAGLGLVCPAPGHTSLSVRPWPSKPPAAYGRATGRGVDPAATVAVVAQLAMVLRISVAS